MADELKYGTPWRDEELDTIVDAYFTMLAADLSGHAYVKSRQTAALMARMGRTHRSVEFKLENISAVLDELGISWIPGYKPKKNYQNAIFDAIDRYLSSHPNALEPTRKAPPAMTLSDGIFVPTPVRTAVNDRIPKRLQRLVQKFDPVERDHRNRSLGKAGEVFVVDLEKRQLVEADRPELAQRVRWVAAEDGDGAGYDVLSFDFNGQARLIEVKTTNGSARTPFFITRNECALAAARTEEWRLYRVHQFAVNPRIFIIAPPLENGVKLTAQTWRASF